MSAPAIRLDGVCVEHRLHPSPAHRLWRTLRGSSNGEVVRVLDDVSLTVAPGESVAVLGANGAGKSTLLHVVAGVLQPTAGRVEVHGSIGALLDLVGAFLGDLTGRQNARFATDLAPWGGPLRPEEEEAIIAFSGLADDIDRPLRTYSSGMQLRLAFATATVRTPDVLLVDEVIAVGDAAFQRRCHDRIGEMRASGTALLLVTHNVLTVPDLCDRVVVIADRGVAFDGDPVAGIDAHYRAVLRGGVTDYVAPEGYGDGRAAIEQAEVLAPGAHRTGDAVRIGFDVRFRDAATAHVGLNVTTPEGTVVYRATALVDGAVLEGRPGDVVRVEVDLQLDVASPDLFVDLGLFDREGAALAVRPRALHLEMVRDAAFVGLTDLRARAHVTEVAREA